MKITCFTLGSNQLRLKLQLLNQIILVYEYTSYGGGFAALSVTAANNVAYIHVLARRK